METTTTYQRPSVTEAISGAFRTNYLNADYGIKSWLLTKDHKRIAILYLISISIFFMIGGAFAGMIRTELITPQGDTFTSETYNKVFTTHGVMMVFFFLIPSIPATLGNFLVPIMIGARDLAFPRINLLSWYIYVVGASLAITAMVLGGVDTGWTFYTPYSSTYSNSYVMLTGVGIFITGFSSILTGLNFIVTIHKMRAPGLTWFRLPLFVWSNYAASLIMVLGTPVVAIGIVMIALERGLGLGIFDPRLGGDPVLFQHIFWFYSHPAVYIMILPGMAVMSDRVLATPHLRLQVRCLLQYRHRGDRLPCVGPSHVRVGAIGVCRHRVLAVHLSGGGALGGEGVQLGGHHVQGAHIVQHADDVRDGLHRPVPRRRPYRSVLRVAGR